MVEFSYSPEIAPIEVGGGRSARALETIEAAATFRGGNTGSNPVGAATSEYDINARYHRFS
jgi:hypothetical protein